MAPIELVLALTSKGRYGDLLELIKFSRAAFDARGGRATDEGRTLDRILSVVQSHVEFCSKHGPKATSFTDERGIHYTRYDAFWEVWTEIGCFGLDEALVTEMAGKL